MSLFAHQKHDSEKKKRFPFARLDTLRDPLRGGTTRSNIINIVRLTLSAGKGHRLDQGTMLNGNEFLQELAGRVEGSRHFYKLW